MDQSELDTLLKMLKEKGGDNSPFAASDLIYSIGDDSYDYARGGYADGGETDPMLDDDISNAVRIAKNPYEGQVLSAPEPMSIGQFLAQNMRRSHETNIREFPQDFSNLAFVQGLKQLPEQVWESIKYPTMALKGELVRGVDPHTGQVTGVTPSGIGPTEAGMVGSGLVSAGALPDIMGGKVASNVLRAGASPEIEAALKTARELHPSGLYSHGFEVAANLPQAKGTADQMVSMLRNQGVKPIELENAGLIDAAGNVHPDWAGKPVTREELSQHLQQSMPQVEETVLGGRGSNYPTKYHQYTLPEGENYREVLLKLPEQEHPLNIAQKRVDEINQKLNEMERNGVPENSAEWKAANAELMKADIDEQKVRNKMLSGEIPYQLEHFQSSHWDEPNVLAHLRMSDRTGPNGEKLLHVEEIQSDWAQKGRKEGFAKELDPKILDKLREEQTSAMFELEDARGAFNNIHEDIFRDNIRKAYKNPLTEYDIPNALKSHQDVIKSTHPQKRFDEYKSNFLRMRETYTPEQQALLQDALDRHVEARDAYNAAKDKLAEYKSSSSGVPNAPYVANTQGWTDLALKRALKEAAEGGYEGIVFTPGAEQAKRYDLSKQVSHISYDPNTNYFQALDHNGRPAINEKVAPEKLPDYVGKDVAEKLLAKEPNNLGVHSLEGQDLSVGGSGMKGYYDKIVPTQIQKLVKGLDKEAKLGKIQTNSLPEMLHLPITEKMRQEILAGQKAFAAGGAIDHALRLARETGGYIPVSKRKHFDDGGDAGGGDGNGGDGGASSDAGNGNGDTGGGSGDNGASSEAGNGNGNAESSNAESSNAESANAEAANAEAANAEAANAEAANAAQADAEASDIGSLGSEAATSAAAQSAAATSNANAANAAMDAATEAATQAAAESSDIGNLGGSAATSAAGQAAAAQSAANAAQAAQEDAESSDIGSLGIGTVSPNTAAMLEGMAQSAIAGPAQGTQVASMSPSPASVANSLAGLALGALGPIGTAVGALNSVSGMVGGPNLGSSLGLSSQGFGTSATTARDSNTTDATGVTGGNAGNGPSAADLGASSAGGYGASSAAEGGGGSGDNTVNQNATNSTTAAEKPTEQQKIGFVAPPTQYVSQTMPTYDFGAADSIARQKTGANLFNQSLLNPIYSAPFKAGGKVTKNDAIGNALKIAMVLANKMEENPLLEDKIRSILLKL